MAADWIKMRSDLYRDPKVCAMADELMLKKGALARYVHQNLQCDMSVTRNVTRNAVVGALVSVWGVMRHRGHRVESDLLLRDMTLAVIDDVADMPGFGDAMARVDWAQETDEGVVFPDFFGEHNVEPEANGRSKSAERQARYRARQASQSDVLLRVTRDVTRDVTLRPREREEREKKDQKKEYPPLSPKEGGAKVHAVPDGFVEFWKSYPRRVAKVDALKAFAKLSPADVALAIAAVPLHIAQWQAEGRDISRIPYPATWLNGQQWNDELTPVVTPRHRQTQPSRQAAIAQALLGDHRYAATAERQSGLALPGHRQGPADAHAALAGLSAGPRHDPVDGDCLDADFSDPRDHGP